MSVSEEVKSEEEASGKKSVYTRSSEKDEEEESDCNMMEWECEALTFVREVPQSFALAMPLKESPVVTTDCMWLRASVSQRSNILLIELLMNWLSTIK